MPRARLAGRSGALDVAVHPDAAGSADVSGTAERRVALDATAEFPVTLEATAEIPVAQRDDDVARVPDPSSMTDPRGAHSPMSPDDRVSDEHPGLHIDSHTTGGTTPQS
jgi:hypothetical protein